MNQGQFEDMLRTAIASGRLTGASIGGFTAARVPFSGAAGTLTEDAEIAWDNTLKTLRIGNPPADATYSQYAAIHVARVGAAHVILTDTYGAQFTWPFRRFNGTIALPTAILNAQGIMALSAGGYDGVDANGVGASLGVVATENWGAGAHGAEMRVFTTLNGAANPTRRWTWQNDGHYVPFASATYDIGVTALRPRNLYLSGSVGFNGVAPPAISAAIIDVAGGAIQDAECRTAVNALLASQRLLGTVTP